MCYEQSVMRDALKKKTPYLLKINRGVVCVGVRDVRVDRQRGRHSGRPLPAAGQSGPLARDRTGPVKCGGGTVERGGGAVKCAGGCAVVDASAGGWVGGRGGGGRKYRDRSERDWADELGFILN